MAASQETAPAQMLQGGDSSWLDTFSVLDPKSFLEGFLKENVRPDGRLLHRVRPTFCNTSVLIKNAAGSSLIKLGQTQVLAAVTLEVGQPAAGHTKEGDLILDWNHSCQSWMERILRESGVVDFKTLCLKEGKAAWRLRIVVMVLNDDENVKDAALLAAVAALAYTKLPKVQFKSDDKVEIMMEGGHRLELQTVPVPLTVGLYTLENKTVLLVDPSPLEKELCHGSITMVVTSQQDIININHAGSVRLTPHELSLCAQMAFGRAREMTSLLVDNEKS